MHSIEDKKSDKHKKAVKDYFSSKTKYWSVLYNEKHEKDTFMNYVMRRRKHYVLESIDNEISQNDKVKVLDVGLGTGIYVSELLNRGMDVYGIDISSEMVKKALFTVASYNRRNLKIITGDAEFLPFKDNYFDLILAIGLVEYLPSEINALKEFNRILKPNGSLIFTLPNILKLNHFIDLYFIIKWTYRFFKNKIVSKTLSNEVKPYDFDSNENFKIKRYKKKQISTFLINSGFKKRKVQGVGYGEFLIFNKRIFSLGWSVKISESIENLSKKKSFKFIDKFATRWVICAQKENND